MIQPEIPQRVAYKDRKQEPIRVFEDLKQFKEIAAEWQHMLFLDDWIISVGWHGMEDYPNEGGHVEYNIENQTATITLMKHIPDDRIIKACHELTLIHEMLHLKIDFLAAPENAEGKLWEIWSHHNVYQMSKSLLMAKYNIDFSWFKNHSSCI